VSGSTKPYEQSGDTVKLRQDFRINRCAFDLLAGTHIKSERTFELRTL